MAVTVRAAVFALCMAAVGCVTVAPPSPMVTMGGPETAGKGTVELAAASGAGIGVFDKAEISEHAWYGRIRQGIGPRLDLGVEALGFELEGRRTVTAKLSARYRIFHNVRIDGGLGVGDNSLGSGVNGDLGVVVGTVRPDRFADVYGALRYGFSHGIAGSVLDPEGARGLGRPANSNTVMLCIGTQMRISPKVRLMWEFGYGRMFPRGSDPGTLAYLGCGAVVNLRWRKDGKGE